MWRDSVNTEYEAVNHSAGNSFRKRGVSIGDIVYVVSLADGRLFLGGRMTVRRIVSRAEAAHILGTDNLWDADEHLIDDESGTPINFHRTLAPEVCRQLRFVSPQSEPKGFFFVSDTRLDVQTTRGVRELTPDSAALLDRIIAITDRQPRSEQIVAVTAEMLRSADGEQVKNQVRPYGQIADERGTGSSPAANSISFHPAIDRYDRRSAGRLFQRLWPNTATSRACAVNLAASVRVAHDASDGSWSVTMFQNMLRLNVGQVEVLTLDANECRFLFASPLDLEVALPFEMAIGPLPVYPAVPVPSGVCFAPAANLVSLPSSVRIAHNAYIQAAASRKSVSPFKKSFSPAVLEYLEVTIGQTLPRPSYLGNGGGLDRVEPLAEEIEDSAVMWEGARYQLMVNAFERDPAARRLCIKSYGTKCFICGISFGAIYGEAAEGFIHVHHLRALSQVREEYIVNPLKDLRPVCPNCHAVLHRREPPYSLDEVRQFLEAQRKAASATRET